MNSLFGFLFILGLVNSPNLAQAQTYAEKEKYTVMLDPGHGGNDIGAFKGTLKESDLTLQIATKVYSLLKDHQNIKVLLTRTSDLFVSLPDRVALAEKNKAKLFVSFHINSNNSSVVKGTEFYLREKGVRDIFYKPSQFKMKIDSSKLTSPTLNNIVTDLRAQAQLNRSLEFSSHLQKQWPQDLTAQTYSMKRAPFYVISHTTMPSLLIEIGYLTNAHDYQNLVNAQYRDELAQKIYKAILEYING